MGSIIWPIDSCHFQWPWMTLKVIACCRTYQMQFTEHFCDISLGFNWHCSLCGPSTMAELLVFHPKGCAFKVIYCLWSPFYMHIVVENYYLIIEVVCHQANNSIINFVSDCIGHCNYVKHHYMECFTKCSTWLAKIQSNILTTAGIAQQEPQIF